MRLGIELSLERLRREVRDIVGPDWIYLYEGAISPEVIASVTDWARQWQLSGSPPMDSLGWSIIPAQTVDFSPPPQQSMMGTGEQVSFSNERRLW